MKPRCPNNCASEQQRPLELNELPQLCEKVRGEIALLRGIAMICETCGTVYVRCRAGTVPVETLPMVGHRA
jgi:hypothetical protein